MRAVFGWAATSMGDALRRVLDDLGSSMIPLRGGAEVWLATGYTDMRRGISGPSLLAQEILKRDPFPRPPLRLPGPSIVSNFMLHQPLNRHSDAFAREGIAIDTATATLDPVPPRCPLQLPGHGKAKKSKSK